MKAITQFFKNKIDVLLFGNNETEKAKEIKSEPDINELEVKCFLRYYFERKRFDWNILQLHLIEVKTLPEKIQIDITLGRPGILIGKGGRTINDITKQLNSQLRKCVYINIKEFNVWQ